MNKPGKEDLKTFRKDRSRHEGEIRIPLNGAIFAAER